MKEKKSLSEQLIQRQMRNREASRIIIRNREQTQREKEEKIDNLHEAVRLGYGVAVERLLNEANVNKIEKGKTPFAIVKECILKEDNRAKLRSYYKILAQLVEAGADTSELSEKERHLIFYLCPSILIKSNLPWIKETGITPSNAKNVKFAKDVFDERYNNFNIRDLQEIPKINLDEHLYEDEDFTVKLFDGSGWGGRSQMGVKLGNIYIQYNPMGKGGYAATIYSIDKKEHKLTMLHEFDGERRSGIDFDAIVPFHLSSFYGDMTCGCGVGVDLREIREAYTLSYDIKKNLIDLALGKEAPSFYIVTNLRQESRGVIPGRNIVGIVQDEKEMENMFSGKAISFKEGYVVYKITDPTANLPQVGSSFDPGQFEKVEVGLYSPVKNNEVAFRPLPNVSQGKSFIGSQLGSFQGTMIKLKDNAEKNRAKAETPPEEFYCMISGEIMQDPVTTITGQTYERQAILTWFETCDKNGRKITDPATGIELTSTTLIPNRNLQDAIQQWEVKYPQNIDSSPTKPSLRQRLLNQGGNNPPTAQASKLSLFSQIRLEQEILRKQQEAKKQAAGEKEKEKEKEVESTTVKSHHEKEKEAEKTPVKTPEAFEEVHLAFECPICSEYMVDPVMTPNGNSYQRESIVDWINATHKDPQTNATISVDELVPNYALKSLIENWQKSQHAKPGDTPGLSL